MQPYGIYKTRAYHTLDGYWCRSAITTFIYFIIMSVPSAVVSLAVDENLGNLVTLLLLPVSWGYAIYFLLHVRMETTTYATLFDGFKDYVRILLTQLLVGLYTFLWSLLLIVPGIIKSYSYALTSFVLLDHPEMKYNAAIEESMRLMKGHKKDLFMIDLTMIGWAILSLLTFGIGFLFLGPYNAEAHAHFYEGLISDDIGYCEEDEENETEENELDLTEE